MMKTFLTPYRIKQSVVLIGAALVAQSAFASGYHFGTQSVSAQSTANASAAEAADPSTLFYNPAGLTKLEGTQATINLNIVAPNVKYHDAEAYYPEIEGKYPVQDKVQGSTSGKITDSVQAVPHMYASHQLNDQFTVGLGAYIPFGSGTEYDHDSVLRYNLNELGLQTIALQPTVAYKLNDQHSFAVGLVAQHTKAELRQYANFGPSVAQAVKGKLDKAGVNTDPKNFDKNIKMLGEVIKKSEEDIAAKLKQGQQPSKADIESLTQMKTAEAGLKTLKAATAESPVANGAADGYAKVKGNDWGFGYTLAWLWDVNDRTRVGVNYRSKVNHTLKGDGEWKLEKGLFSLPGVGETLQQGIRARGYAEKEDASVKITTPESISVHGMYKVNPQWNVFGDVTWTRHSRFNQANLFWGNEKTVLRADSGDTNAAVDETQSNVTILTPKWRNTYKVSLGASYQYSEPLQLRFGVAYDQSPVKNANLRMTTLPDNDRIWLSVGAKYDFAKQHTLNVAYSHLFIKNASANVNGFCGADSAKSVACVSSKTNGSAKFKSSANILGLQYTYKF